MAGDWGSGFSIPQRKKRKITNMWSVEFAPISLDEIAVHKSKISFLEEVLERKLKYRDSPFLLLFGPSGCGKTTSVNLVAKKLKIKVHEWLNPISFDQAFVYSEEAEYNTGGPQEMKFSEFLLKTSRYKELQFFTAGQSDSKVMLVKDFPNTFMKSPTRFSDVLKKYIAIPKASPCIFIVSGIEGNSHLMKTLFPDKLIRDLKIECIKFNPIAPTAMMKGLQSVLKKVSSHINSRLTLPTKEILEEIVGTSNGDLRVAINSLQFMCLKDTKKLQPKFSKNKNKMSHKRVDSIEHVEHCLGAKDAVLPLFRVLGKILHSKRSTQLNPIEDKLPLHLQHLKRASLSFDPDVMLEKSCLSIDTYLSTLHHNYIGFCEGVQQISQVSEYLSEADVVMGDWSVRPSLISCQSSLVTRGLVFSLNTAEKTGWKPLYKPALFGVFTKILSTKEKLMQHFFPLCKNCSKFAVDVLPYYAFIPSAHLNAEQSQYSSRVGTFTSTVGTVQEVLEGNLLEFDCDHLDSLAEFKPNVNEHLLQVKDLSENQDLCIEDVD